MEITDIGRTLAQARIQRQKLADYPVPTAPSLPQGYTIQDAMIAAMGQPVVGWKVGLTSTAAQKVIGVDEPIAGPLFADAILDDGATIATQDSDLRIVEAEIAVRLRAALPDRSGPYQRDDVASMIATVHPMFELANKRLPGGPREVAPWLVADGAINQAIVLGPGTAFTPQTDLAAETVTLQVDAAQVSQGIGANAMGDPLAVVTWLANHLHDRHIALNAGDVIATGLICDLIIGERGQHFDARFGSIGSVTMTLT